MKRNLDVICEPCRRQARSRTAIVNVILKSRWSLARNIFIARDYLNEQLMANVVDHMIGLFARALPSAIMYLTGNKNTLCVRRLEFSSSD